MKRAPTYEKIARVTNFDLREKNSLSVFIFVFILFATGISAASYITYENYEKQFRAQVDNQLAAIGSLKVEELQDWRAERLADASLFYQNENFSERVQTYLKNPQNAEARIKLLAWMEKVRASPEYDRIFLLDARGVEQVSIPAAREAIPESLIEQASISMASNKIIFLDFHRHSASDVVHLSMIVPVFDSQDNQPLGVLVLRINPGIHLYPFIRRWPVPSQSAETILVRRDGEDILYLNDLKFELDTALNLRIPLTRENVSAVKAVLGKTGVYEGTDYRGVATVADLRPVPNSPWFLISKMDTAEVYAPLRARLWQTIFFFAALALAAGTGLMLIWRQQQTRFYRGKVEAVEALRASEEKFRTAFDTSPDALTITRLSDGMFVSVNKGFEQISGYSRDQVIGKTSTEINIWKNPQDRKNVIEELMATGEVRNYEAPFIVLDGEIYGLMSAVTIKLNGESHILNITRDITARKRAEEALRQSEANLTALIENTDGSIWAVDKHYGLIVGNREFHNNINAVLGRRLNMGESVLLPKFSLEANAEWLERYDRALQGERFTLETVTRFRDEPRYIEYRFSPIRENAAEIRGVTVYGRDITERKQAEEALIQTNNRLALAQRLAGAGIWDWNFATGKLNWSPEFFHLFGLDPATAEATFDTWRGILHPDDIQSAEQRITEAIRDHAPLFNEYRIIIPSGETRWIGAWGDVTYDERGEAQRMTGLCIDITERKQMDEKLRASEEKFRMAFNTSPIAISIARLKGGGFVSINKSFEQMSGYSESEMIGKTAEELRFWKSPEVHQSLLKELHDKGEVRDYETPIQSRNGEIYCLTSASLIEINGEPHILTLAVDITERKQAREQLLQTMQELKRSNTELEQFAYIASHDLQEPLRAVAGMVQLLQKRYQGQLDQRADEYISLAIDGATRMQTLINDLLAYSRVERRGNPIQSIDANKSLASALRNLQISIAEQGATITNDPLPTLEADPTQLTQLFQNLIGNAIKFHGETPPQIHIAAEDLGEGWRFSVHDNGIGIEPQYFERVFLIFQRLHTRREYSGTGIGLSVCKKIVEWHGGRIWIESQIGRGSTFYFTIPHRSKP